MPIADKLGDKVTNPADPQRCQAVAGAGQCEYRTTVPGGKYCVRHGGKKEQEKLQKEGVRMYQSQVWQKRIGEMSDDPNVKTLRNEIGILRITLEATLNKCKEPEDLFMMASNISDLAVKIEKLVKSCASLEENSGQLMDKSKAIAFAGQIVELIDRVTQKLIMDDDLREKVVDEISAEILTTLQESSSP